MTNNDSTPQKQQNEKKGFHQLRINEVVNKYNDGLSTAAGFLLEIMEVLRPLGSKFDLVDLELLLCEKGTEIGLAHNVSKITFQKAKRKLADLQWITTTPRSSCLAVSKEMVLKEPNKVEENTKSGNKNTSFGTENTKSGNKELPNKVEENTLNGKERSLEFNQDNDFGSSTDIQRSNSQNSTELQTVQSQQSATLFNTKGNHELELEGFNSAYAPSAHDSPSGSDIEFREEVKSTLNTWAAKTGGLRDDIADAIDEMEIKKLRRAFSGAKRVNDLKEVIPSSNPVGKFMVLAGLGKPRNKKTRTNTTPQPESHPTPQSEIQATEEEFIEVAEPELAEEPSEPLPPPEPISFDEAFNSGSVGYFDNDSVILTDELIDKLESDGVELEIMFKPYPQHPTFIKKSKPNLHYRKFVEKCERANVRIRRSDVRQYL